MIEGFLVMKRFSLILINVLFLVGFFRVFKNCSKGDDLAKSSGYMKNFDDAGYAKNYRNVGKYQEVSVTYLNHEYLEKLSSVERKVDELMLGSLKNKKPELKKIIESAELETSDKVRFEKIEKIKEKYLSESESLKYAQMFKKAKLLLDLKEWYHFEGDEMSHDFKLLDKDSTYKFSGFSVNIPKGFGEISSLKHPMVEKIWTDEKSFVTAFKVQKSDSIKSLSFWRKFKDNKNDTHLLTKHITQEVKNYRVIKSMFIQLGYVKIKENKGKTIIVEQEYNTYTDVGNSRLKSINKILK